MARDLIKEVISDAKQVREASFENAKKALLDSTLPIMRKLYQEASLEEADDNSEETEDTPKKKKSSDEEDEDEPTTKGKEKDSSEEDEEEDEEGTEGKSKKEDDEEDEEEEDSDKGFKSSKSKDDSEDEDENKPIDTDLGGIDIDIDDLDLEEDYGTDNEDINLDDDDMIEIVDDDEDEDDEDLGEFNFDRPIGHGDGEEGDEDIPIVVDDEEDLEHETEEDEDELESEVEEDEDELEHELSDDEEELKHETEEDEDELEHESESTEDEEEMEHMYKEMKSLGYRNRKLMQENRELKVGLKSVSRQLREIALFNVRYAYATKLFNEGYSNVPVQTKAAIAKKFDAASTIPECKKIYEALAFRVNEHNRLQEAKRAKAATAPTKKVTKKVNHKVKNALKENSGVTSVAKTKRLNEVPEQPQNVDNGMSKEVNDFLHEQRRLAGLEHDYEE